MEELGRLTVLEKVLFWAKEQDSVVLGIREPECSVSLACESSRPWPSR